MENVFNLRENYSRLVIPEKTVKSPAQESQKAKRGMGVIFAASIPLLLKPTYAFAATNSNSFENIYLAVMGMFDYGVVLVIVFAGAAWALGHRSKAIEYIIGASCGYLLAMHATDIRDFLKGLKN